jgi:tRNA-binding protein
MTEADAPLAVPERLAEVPAEQFFAVDIRVGTVVECDEFPQARIPAYRMLIDAGPLGQLVASARLTDHYSREQLIGSQVVCAVNFPPRQIGPVRSEVLVLGVYEEGTSRVVLLRPDRPCRNGDQIG